MSEQDWCRPGRCVFVVNEGVWKLVKRVTEDAGVLMEDGSNYCRTELSEDGVIDDMVNHPPHYTSHPSGIECIQVTEHMSFTIGNAVKYLWRADLKNGLEDLKKAAWYIQREIERREKDNG